MRLSPDGSTATTALSDASFEFEGVNVMADCADNILFAPTRLASFQMTSFEEEYIFQLVGATGEVRQVLYGPALNAGLSDIDVLFYDRRGQRLLIWTDIHGGKIFAFPLSCGGLEVTAHLVTRADVDLQSADPAPTRRVPRADGTQEAVWVLPRVDQRGAAVQLNLLFHQLHEGEQRTAFQEAFLELRNSFVPGETVRIPLHVPTVLASSAIALAADLDKPHYGAGETAQITVTVRNDGHHRFAGTLELLVADAAGVAVATLPPLAVDLTGLEARPFHSQWQTGTTFAGAYAVQAPLVDAAAREVATGAVTFTLGPATPGNAVVTATVTPDQGTYAAWDTGRLGVRVRNNSANTIQPPMTVVVTVTSPSDVVLVRKTRLLGELFPAAWWDITIPFTLVDQASGTYTVTLTVQDASNGALVTTVGSTFLVNRTAVQGLTGGVTVAAGTVTVGQTQPCTASLHNHGTVAVHDLPVQQLVVALDQPQIRSSLPSSLSLPAQTTRTLVYSLATAALTPGAYACVLQVWLEGAWATLGHAGFRLVPPPNQQPVANAGPDRSAFVGETVSFDGSGSTDPEGDPLTYAWTLHSAPVGSTAALAQSQSVTPSLRVDRKGPYALTLVVHDGKEASRPATVTLRVGNRPPVAEAGRPQHAETGTPVTLQGSQSFDPDGDLLTYAWSIEWGVEATPATSVLSDADLTGRDTPTPSFTPDVDGTYVLRLIVNDTEADSAPAWVTVNAATPNVPPNAHAGSDHNALVGQQVALDGRASADPDQGPQPLTFLWSFATTPPGSTLQTAIPGSR